MKFLLYTEGIRFITYSGVGWTIKCQIKTLAAPPSNVYFSDYITNMIDAYSTP